MDITADDIIDDLGGTSEVARLIHAPISTVHSWRTIGIGKSRLAHLKIAAAVANKTARWPDGDGPVRGSAPAKKVAA